MKVLLVDDDTDLLDVTCYALRREGFNVITATDGQQALSRWKAENPDVVVLDITMPKLNGLQVCHEIRQSSSTPVILLTAHQDEEHTLRGFQMGADDYVTKPFSPRQLAMRIRAVWRRGARTGEPEPVKELRLADLVLDMDSHEAHQGDRIIHLTPIEFRLLYMLASNVGRVVNSSRLVDYAWGYSGGEVGLLKTHISHIRSKLGLGPGKIGEITAVPGVGYRLTYGTTPSREQAS